MRRHSVLIQRHVIVLLLRKVTVADALLVNQRTRRFEDDRQAEAASWSFVGEQRKDNYKWAVRKYVNEFVRIS